ncbi:MAG TPA: calcium-binding protein [Candidatus Deferrimicrobium sp.]|nr:calcium-binding protein [Candidatus Deferrimicrobium sp.]
MARVIVFALIAALLAIPGVSSTAMAAKPRCDGQKATIVGTDKSQVMQGTPRRDVIVAKGGSDRIFSGGGDDVICAGTGNDLIDAGNGKDRIFGGNGNDELKGGAGRDLLDGGDGQDGCYPAAGGDRVVRCEESDLSVSIISPVNVAGDAPIAFTIRVKNVGSKRSGPTQLMLTQVATAAICGLDHSGISVLESVWPGAYVDADFSIASGCSIQAGGDSHLDITAAVESLNPDDDPTNDQVTASIGITSSAMPTPTPTPTPTPIAL